MKTITSALLAVAAIAFGLFLSAPANASNSVCAMLDAAPTVFTVEAIMMSLFNEGVSSGDAAALVFGSVSIGCPEYFPVLQAFADKWNTDSTV